MTQTDVFVKFDAGVCGREACIDRRQLLSSSHLHFQEGGAELSVQG